MLIGIDNEEMLDWNRAEMVTSGYTPFFEPCSVFCHS